MMITSLYAGLLTILYFFISLETIQARGREKVSLGAGNENQILHLVSAHSNFASYAPIFLILMFLLEGGPHNNLFLHLIAACFLLGRILHFLTMKNKEKTFKKRKLGMQLTLFPLIILATMNIYSFFVAAI